MKQFQSLYNFKPMKESVDMKILAAISDAHALEVWGNEFARGDPFPVFDADDNAFAYVFPYALGVSTFPSDVEFAVNQPQNKTRFGTIYISTQLTTHPVLRVVHSLHPLFLRGKQAEMIGSSMITAGSSLSKIYWLGLHQEYFEVKSVDKRVLLDVRNLKQVASTSIFKPSPAPSKWDENNKYWKATTSKETSKQILTPDKKEIEATLKNLTIPKPLGSWLGGPPVATILKLVPLADCVPAVNWTWWCVPTAFTMVTCYYDNYNKAIGGILDYGRLVGYWFDHPISGHNVPDFIDQIVDPNTGTWRIGFNGFSDFIKKMYGYTFATQDITADDTNDWAWNDITTEIDAGRPFVWGVPDHATCAFGYHITTNGKFIVLNTTWGDDSATQREEWLYTKGTGLTKIIPGGGTAGQNLEVWQPDGAETLLTNVSTTIKWYVWGDQIKTAEILVSADGGNTWTKIAEAAPCVIGWNYYDWTPPTVTDRARVRIRGLDANGVYMAGDGSQKNFKVLPGPRPVTLKTILVKTNTDANGFFSSPHGLEHYTPDGYAIHGILVAVQHKNGNWHTLESSNTIDNRFWWNKDTVEGIIASPNFFMQSVQIIIFAESVVG